MFRRFRRGRRDKHHPDGGGGTNSKRGTTVDTSVTNDEPIVKSSPSSSSVVPEKSPSTPPSVVLKAGRRRARGTPSTVAESPQSVITSTPNNNNSNNNTPSPRLARNISSIPTEDMQSNNLLNDMQAQLDAKIPELPKHVKPISTKIKQQQQQQKSKLGTNSGTAPVSAAACGTLFNGVDSGCLPKTRGATATTATLENNNNNIINTKISSAIPSKTTPSVSQSTEDETDAWNRITKEAAEWDKEGTKHFEKGDYDQAFLCYEKALTLKRQTLQPKTPQESSLTSSSSSPPPEASLMASMATSINNMTYLRQRSGKATADETMAAYLQSLQMKREILGPHHLSVGKTLNNIGSVFYLQREYEPALKAYLQAFGIMQDQLGPSHVDVGTVLSNIGDVYFAMKEKESSKEHYRKALDIRWGALGPFDPKVVRLMEQLAFLETGKQPSKDAEDLSDSEDEEFAVEDRLRQESFQEEVRILHDELAADMKFFDLLERKMAIDMVRDKTRMFRKMRQLTDLTMDEIMDQSESTVYSEAELVAMASPVMRPLEEVKPQGQSPTMEELANESGVDSGTFFPEDMINTTPESSSATSFLDRNTALMTTEERKEALQTVRDRLATLRASRKAHKSGFEDSTDMNGLREVQTESLQAA